MKIALYIEDGYEQIVLTPTSDTEKLILGKLTAPETGMLVKQGGFYHCQGGWLRESPDRDSTIIVLDRRES